MYGELKIKMKEHPEGSWRASSQGESKPAENNLELIVRDDNAKALPKMRYQTDPALKCCNTGC